MTGIRDLWSCVQLSSILASGLQSYDSLGATLLFQKVFVLLEIEMVVSFFELVYLLFVPQSVAAAQD